MQLRSFGVLLTNLMFLKKYFAIPSYSQDVSAACTCYAAAATLVEETKLLKCSAKDAFNTVKASKSNCLDKFSVGS